MNSFNAELNTRLIALREQNLFRELRQVDSTQGPRIEIGGKRFLNFSSNDYLGLASHPALKESAIKAVEKFGAGFRRMSAKARRLRTCLYYDSEKAKFGFAKSCTRAFN